MEKVINFLDEIKSQYDLKEKQCKKDFETLGSLNENESTQILDSFRENNIPANNTNKTVNDLLSKYNEIIRKRNNSNHNLRQILLQNEEKDLTIINETMNDHSKITKSRELSYLINQIEINNDNSNITQITQIDPEGNNNFNNISSNNIQNNHNYNSNYNNYYENNNTNTRFTFSNNNNNTEYNSTNTNGNNNNKKDNSRYNSNSNSNINLKVNKRENRNVNNKRDYERNNEKENLLLSGIKNNDELIEKHRHNITISNMKKKMEKCEKKFF